MVQAIGEELGPGVEITGGDAGMNLSITLKGIHDNSIADEAARQGLWLVPLSSSYLRRPARQGFILGFGSTPVEQIPGAVRRLAALIKRARG
jgi:GntR family transcriptional regulator/MocR family aminotransferase